MNKKNIKRLVDLVLKPITESLDVNMPRYITLYDKDIMQASAEELDELIDNNIISYKNKSPHIKLQITNWWNNFWDEKCDNIGGSISEIEIVRHISKEGFVII